MRAFATGQFRERMNTRHLFAAQLTFPRLALAFLCSLLSPRLGAQLTLTYAGGETNTSSYTLTGANTFTIDSGSATQGGAISGPGSLTKSGVGTLTLSAANTYSGGTTISAGTLVFSAPTALYNGDTAQWHKVSVTNGARLGVDAAHLAFNSSQLNSLLTSASFASGLPSLELHFASSHALTHDTNLSGLATAPAGFTLSGATALALNSRTLTLGAAANQTLAVNRALTGGAAGGHGASGRYAENGASGGWGGGLVVSGGTVSFTSALSINGGAGGHGGTGGPTEYGWDDAGPILGFPAGGHAGHGGAGGTLTFSGGTAHFAQTISLSGGGGGVGGVGVFDTFGTNQGGHGGNGGNGGALNLTGGTVNFTQALTLAGGAGGAGGATEGGSFTAGGNGGYGGIGGTVTLSAGTTNFIQAVNLTGGTGGVGGAGGSQFDGSYSPAGASRAGGAGGSFTLSGGTASFAATSSLDLSGGSGAGTGSAGALSLSGGTLQLTTVGWLESPTTFRGNLVFTGGILQATASGESLVLDGTSRLGQALANPAVTAARTLDLAGNLTLSSAIAGSGALIKTGAGFLTLTGTNTHSGGTTLTAGTLAISSSVNLGSGAVNVTGGTLTTAADFLTLDRAVSVGGTGAAFTTAGDFYFGTAAPLTLNAGGSVTAGGTIGFGTNAGATNSSSVTGTGARLTVGNKVLLGYSGTGSLTIADGGIVATSTLIFAEAGGTGTLNLNSGGTLEVGGTQGIRSGASSLSFNLAGGAIKVTGSDLSTHVPATLAASTTSTINTNGLAATFSGILSGPGALEKSGAGTLTLTAANTYAGGTTVSAGTLQIGHAGATGSVTGNITNHGTVAFHRSDDFIFGGAISGTGGLTMNGNILRLSSAQTYTGPTSINTGILVLPSHVDQSLAASTAVTIASGASLDISNRSLTVAGLAGAGTVYSFGGSAGHLTVNTAVDAPSAFSGTLGGPFADFALTKTGAGTLTLSAANTYTGATTVNAGTLRLAGSARNSAFTINSGGTLEIGGLNAITSGAGALNLAGGTLKVIDSALTTSVPATLTDSSTINTNGLAATFSGVLSGSGALEKSGAGTLTLSGANTFTGGTTLSAGTLVLASAGALSSSGALSFSGGTLQFVSANLTDYSSRFSTAANQLYAFDTNAQNVTFASALTSSGGTLTKLGSGTLTLSAANTYTGGTTLSAGTLVLGHANALGSTGAITFGGGTLQFTAAGTTDYSSRFSSAANQLYAFDTNGQSVTFASALSSNGGSLTKTGTGTLTLSGANTYTGTTTVSAGTLQIADGGSVAGNLINNASLIFDRSGDLTLAGNLTGSGSLIKTGSATVTFLTGGAFNGGLTVNAGALALPSVGVLLLPVNVTDGALTVGGNLRISNSLAIAGGSVTSSTGRVTLGDGAGSYLNVSAGGTLSAREVVLGSSANALVTGTGSRVTSTLPLTLTDGILTVSSGGTVTAPSIALGLSTLALQNGGTLEVGGPNGIQHSGTGALALAGGTLKVTGSALTTSVPATLTNTSIVDTNALGATFSGVLSGSGSLTKTGSGNLILSGATAYSGGTTISAGTLTLTNETYHSLAGNIINNGVLALSALGGFALPGAISGPGSLTISDARFGLSFGNANTYSGGTTITGGFFSLNSVDPSAALSRTLGTGPVLVTGGFIEIPGGLSNPSLVITGGTVQDFSIYGFKLPLYTRIEGPTAELSVSRPKSAFIMTLDILGGGRFDISQSFSSGGEFTVSGVNSRLTAGELVLYSGRMTVGAGGTVSIGNLNFSDGSGGISLSGATVLEAANGGTLLTGNLIQGATGGGSGTGTLALSGGTLKVANQALTVGVPVVLTNSSNVDTNAQSATFSGLLSGLGGLIKAGVGTLTLSAANTYSGDTTVNAGTLHLTGSALNSAFTVNSGGTLSGTGTLGPLTINSGGLLSPGSSPGILTSGAQTWNGGGSLLWEINNATGTAGATSGTGWDLLSLSGPLTIAANASSPFTINLTSLSAANFNPAANYSFNFLAASGGIIGFDTTDFILNPFGFGPTSTGTWSIAAGANALSLNYTAASAIPEPSTYAAFAGAAALALAVYRRRRSRDVRPRQSTPTT